MKAALASFLQRLRTTLESISDAFYTFDRDWRFTYVNHEAERLLQASSPGLLGQQLWQAFPGSYDSEIGEQQSDGDHRRQNRAANDADGNVALGNV